MGVAAERQTTVGRPKALKGLARSENVNPVRWRACARMDVKPVALDHRQRKAGEKQRCAGARRVRVHSIAVRAAEFMVSLPWSAAAS